MKHKFDIKGVMVPERWRLGMCPVCGRWEGFNLEAMVKDIKQWLNTELWGAKDGAKEIGISPTYFTQLVKGSRPWTEDLAKMFAVKVFWDQQEVWTERLPGVLEVPVPAVHVAPARKAGEPWREVRHGEMVLGSGNIVRLAAGLGEKPQPDSKGDASQPDGDVV